jgi:SAM-dependent methyltransferase
VSILPDRDPWWATWFGEEYLALYPERDDLEARNQAHFVRHLLEPFAKRGPAGVLDLACGTGRHAVSLARPNVFRVTGLDLSLTLLAQARLRPDPPELSYVRADMRRLPFRSGVFGGVVNFFTSFGYFDDPADDLSSMCEVARILAPGGAFLADFFNAERVVATLASQEDKLVAGLRVSIRRRYDPVTRRVEKTIEMGAGAERRVFRERVRAYREKELLGLLKDAGFSTGPVYGDFDGQPFDVKRSPRLILLAARA